MANTIVLDKFKGCILGLACGDALGASVEFDSPETIKRKHGELCNMIGGGWLNLMPGEYTDDTQMMLCILESLAANEKLDCKDIADRFVDWYLSKPKDIGNLTRSAIGKLAAGIRWQDAGRSAWEESGCNSAGNGGLMRCAPVGLMRFSDNEWLAQYSRDTCRITHYDQRCQESCVALNLTIAAHLSGRNISEADIQEHISLPEVIDIIEQTKTATLDQAERWAQGGYTLHTLAVAFWAYHNFDSFEEGLVRVVNLGGDADTTGAVAGALLGAKFGASAIPHRWLSVLQDRQELEELASRVHRIPYVLTVPFPRSYWVVPGMFLAGYYPGDVNDVEAQKKLRGLLDAGIALTINLVEPQEQNNSGSLFGSYEEMLCKLATDMGRDVKCVRVPIRDMGIPNRETMKKILDIIDNSIAQDRPVYVHCVGGLGRTGTVVGCWLARHGITRDKDVIDVIHRLRRNELLGWVESPQSAQQINMVRMWQESE